MAESKGEAAKQRRLHEGQRRRQDHQQPPPMNQLDKEESPRSHHSRPHHAEATGVSRPTLAGKADPTHRRPDPSPHPQHEPLRPAEQQAGEGKKAEERRLEPRTAANPGRISDSAALAARTGQSLDAQPPLRPWPAATAPATSYRCSSAASCVRAGTPGTRRAGSPQSSTSPTAPGIQSSRASLLCCRQHPP